MKGLFISFEGADGSGKSTQIKRVADRLIASGYDVVQTREPGGTQVAEKVRSMVLDSSLPLNTNTEVLLYLAARSEHIEKIILPALKQGKIVLSDRFSDSTMVYQGLANGLSYDELKELQSLNAFACQGLQSHLTILLDGDTDKLLSRRTQRGISDKYEDYGLEYQRLIRRGFLTLAEHEPERIKIINACREEKAVENEIIEAISRLL